MWILLLALSLASTIVRRHVDVSEPIDIVVNPEAVDGIKDENQVIVVEDLEGGDKPENPLHDG